MDGATFQKEAWFSGTDFGYAGSFIDTNFGGQSYFHESVFQRIAKFSTATFAQGVHFKNTRFLGDRPSFKKAVFKQLTSFTSAEFRNEADFNGSTFEKACEFIGTRFGGNVEFKEAKFHSDSNFWKCRFLGQTDFSEATFGAVAEFVDTKFRRDTEFGKATFGKPASFARARFCGSASFHNTIFHGGAAFADAWFRGNAFFEDATFQDVTGFPKARFKGTANFSWARFEKDALFDHALFLDDAYFHRTDFVTGLAIRESYFLKHLFLVDNKFGFPSRLIDCGLHRVSYQTHKGENLAFSRCHMVWSNGRSIYWDDYGGEQRVTCHRARFPPTDLSDCLLDFRIQMCRNVTFQNMDLSRAAFLGADLEGTRFISCTWEGNSLSRYRRPYLDPRHASAAKSEDVEALRSVEALCRQMRAVLEKDKHFAQAGDFHYHEMRARRQLLRISAKRQRRKGWVQRFVLGLYWLTSDYGENYWRLFWLMVGSIVLTGAFVSVVEAQCACGSDLIAAASDKFPESLYKTFMGLMPFSTARSVDLETLYPFSKVLIALEGLALLSFTALFLMAINRRFRR
jgi:uncharacterized protein YjbI with pentapeptide repeats